MKLNPLVSKDNADYQASVLGRLIQICISMKVFECNLNNHLFPVSHGFQLNFNYKSFNGNYHNEMCITNYFKNCGWCHHDNNV